MGVACLAGDVRRDPALLQRVSEYDVRNCMRASWMAMGFTVTDGAFCLCKPDGSRARSPTIRRRDSAPWTRRSVSGGQESLLWLFLSRDAHLATRARRPAADHLGADPARHAFRGGAPRPGQLAAACRLV